MMHCIKTKCVLLKRFEPLLACCLRSGWADEDSRHSRFPQDTDERAVAARNAKGHVWYECIMCNVWLKLFCLGCNKSHLWLINDHWMQCDMLWIEQLVKSEMSSGCLCRVTTLDAVQLRVNECSGSTIGLRTCTYVVPSVCFPSKINIIVFMYTQEYIFRNGLFLGCREKVLEYQRCLFYSGLPCVNLMCVCVIAVCSN